MLPSPSLSLNQVVLSHTKQNNWAAAQLFILRDRDKFSEEKMKCADMILMVYVEYMAMAYKLSNWQRYYIHAF